MAGDDVEVVFCRGATPDPGSALETAFTVGTQSECAGACIAGEPGCMCPNGTVRAVFPGEADPGPGPCFADHVLCIPSF
jgi:hypothetical protein